jgi:hypothetical protein
MVAYLLCNGILVVKVGICRVSGEVVGKLVRPAVAADQRCVAIGVAVEDPGEPGDREYRGHQVGGVVDGVVSLGADPTHNLVQHNRHLVTTSVGVSVWSADRPLQMVRS